MLILTGCITGTMTGKFQTYEVGIIEINADQILIGAEQFHVFKSRNYFGQTKYFTKEATFILDWRVRRFYIFEPSRRWPRGAYKVQQYSL